MAGDFGFLVCTAFAESGVLLFKAFAFAAGFFKVFAVGGCNELRKGFHLIGGTTDVVPMLLLVE